MPTLSFKDPQSGKQFDVPVPDGVGPDQYDGLVQHVLSDYRGSQKPAYQPSPTNPGMDPNPFSAAAAGIGQEFAGGARGATGNPNLDADTAAKLKTVAAIWQQALGNIGGAEQAVGQYQEQAQPTVKPITPVRQPFGYSIGRDTHGNNIFLDPKGVPTSKQAFDAAHMAYVKGLPAPSFNPLQATGEAFGQVYGPGGEAYQNASDVINQIGPFVQKWGTKAANIAIAGNLAPQMEQAGYLTPQGDRPSVKPNADTPAWAKTLSAIPQGVGEVAGGTAGFLPSAYQVIATAPFAAAGNPQAQKEIAEFQQGNRNAAGLGPQGPVTKALAGDIRGSAQQLLDKLQEDPVTAIATIAGGVGLLRGGMIKAGTVARDTALANATELEVKAVEALDDVSAARYSAQAETARAQAAKIDARLPTNVRKQATQPEPQEAPQAEETQTKGARIEEAQASAPNQEQPKVAPATDGGYTASNRAGYVGNFPTEQEAQAAAKTQPGTIMGTAEHARTLANANNEAVARSRAAGQALADHEAQMESGGITPVARNIQSLPPLGEDHVRAIHMTDPDTAEEIAKNGLDYSKQGILQSTARYWSNAADVPYDKPGDRRFNRMSAVVMDIPQKDLRLHNDVTRSPGVVSPEHVVGIIPNEQLGGESHALKYDNLAESQAKNPKPLPITPINGSQDFADAIRQHFGYTDDEANANIALVDARAKAWSQLTGKPTEDYYKARFAAIGRGDSVGMPQDVHGSVHFLDANGQPIPIGSLNMEGRAVIKALSAPNVSTAAHEIGHVFRRDMYREGGVSPEDQLAVERWAGADGNNWTADAEEKFARGWERYLADGTAPNEALRRVFEQFKQWMLSIYKAVTGTPEGFGGTQIKAEVSPEVKAVFDKLLGKEEGEDAVRQRSAKTPTVGAAPGNREEVGSRVSEPEPQGATRAGESEAPEGWKAESHGGVNTWTSTDGQTRVVHGEDGYTAYSSKGPSKTYQTLDEAVKATEGTAAKKGPEYVDSQNLDRLNISEGAKDIMRANMKNERRNQGKPVKWDDTRKSGQQLGIQVDHLKTLPVGELPIGPDGKPVDVAHFSDALGQLTAYVAEKASEAARAYAENKTPENEAANLQALLDYKTVADHNSYWAAKAGELLGQRNNNYNPTKSEQVMEALKNAPEMATKPAMSVKTKTAPKTKTVKPAAERTISEEDYQKALAALKGVLHQEDAGVLHQLAGDDPRHVVGTYHFEDGKTTYDPWKKAVEESVGEGKIPESDLQALFTQIKGEAEANTVKQQRAIAKSAFVSQLARRFKSWEKADAFVDEIADADGTHTILDALIHNKPLTEDQKRIVGVADAKGRTGRNPPTAKDGMKVLEDIRKETNSTNRGKKGTPKQPTALTSGDLLEKSIASSLRADGAKELRAKMGDVWDKVADGTATKNEINAFTAAHEAIRSKLTPTNAAPGYKAPGLAEALKSYRAKQKAAPAPRTGSKRTPTPDSVKALGSAVGKAFENTTRSAINRRLGVDGYDKVKALRPDELGKFERGEAMTDQEKLNLANTINDLKKPRNPAAESAAVANLRKIIADAKGGKLQYDDPADMTRDFLMKALPEGDTEGVAKIAQALANVDRDDAGQVTYKGRQQLAEAVNALSRQSLADNIEHYIRANLLSNPATLTKIAISHLLSAATEDLPVRAVAAGVDRAIAARSGQRSVQGVNLKDTAGAVKAGLGAHNEAVETFWHGENAANLGKHTPFHEPGKPFNPEFTSRSRIANAVFRTPMRSHAALYRMIGSALYDRGVREAAALEAQKPGAAHDAEWYRQNPTPEMMDHAREQYRQQMFMNDNRLNTAARALTRAKNPLIRVPANAALPFSKVPSNIAGRSVEYNPVGSAVSALKQFYDIKATGKPMTVEQQANLARTIGRGVTGTALTYLGYELAREHMVNAQNEKKHEYGSVNAGGRKTDVSGLGPIATPALLGANIRQAQEQKESGLTPDYGAMVKDYLSEQPMLRTTDTALNALGDPHALSALAGNTMSMFVPLSSGMRGYAAQRDQYARSKASPLDYVKAAIAGQRETLPPVLDTFGQPVPEAGNMVGLRSTPIQNRTPEQQKVLDAFEMLDDIQKEAMKPARTQAELQRRQTMQAVARGSIKYLAQLSRYRQQLLIGNASAKPPTMDPKVLNMTIDAMHSAKEGKDIDEIGKRASAILKGRTP